MNTARSTLKLQTLRSSALLRVARVADDRITVARTTTSQDRLYNVSRLALRLLQARVPGALTHAHQG